MSLTALVTGANGMLGDALCPLLKKKGYFLYETDLLDNGPIFKLDVKDLGSVREFIKNKKIDIIFHLAAETDVDKCELNREHAYRTNAEGTKNMAIACRESGITLVYISTAAVFDGKKEKGYTEEDEPGNCVNIYGRSKLEGEEAVRSLLTNYYIVRASWMIGGFKKDKKFVWKIIQLLNTNKEIAAVTDKSGSPTFTTDFAKGLIDITSTGAYGLYHCVNKGICTRFDIAGKIAEYLNKKDVIIKPVGSDFFSLPAPRPRSEALVNHRLSRMGMNNTRPWQEALKEYIDEMK